MTALAAASAAARPLHRTGRQEDREGIMGRVERAFLAGFGKAAVLAQRIIADPPRYTTPQEYLRDVADLHADSEDLCSRGLAVGCLSAFGRG